MNTYHRSIPILSLLLLLTPLAASADDCPTWFPDLECDRQARFDGFVAPMSMPYLFEDPFITSGAQFVGIWHDFPKNGNLDLGQAGVLALQLRLALTDRLAFIATKDGLVFYESDTETLAELGLSPSGKKLLDNEVGFTDITAGFKYAAIVMPEENFILTPALRYEIPVGNRDVFQGRGDGVFIPSVSAAWGIGDLHLIGNVGAQFAINHENDSDSIFYNLHVDYAVLDKLVPFVSLNGMSWIKSGDGSNVLRTSAGPVPLDTAQKLLGTGHFEGADYANLGSSSATTQDLLTLAWGIRFPLSRHVSLGALYEHPLTGSRNLFKQRVQVVATYEF